MYERNNFGNYRELVMTTHETQISQVYGSEDAQGILQLAIARSQNASPSITVHQWPLE